MHIAEDNEFVAKTFHGLEEILAEEIKNIGGENIEILTRAVKFTGNKRLLYKANIYLRTALRILVPIANRNVRSNKDIYKIAKTFRWEDIFSSEQTFLVSAVTNSKYIDHSYYAALKFKDGIADRFRHKFQKRPSVDKNKPDYKIDLHISGTNCTISLDSSSESLHKRGYKESNVLAPLSEALAAGLILLSGWDKQSPFIDPMCGSGTLPIEACMIANDIPPGIFRTSFGFKRWNNFDKAIFESITENVNIQPSRNVKIIGSDISERAIQTARLNCENAEFEQSIELFVTNFKDFKTKDYSSGTMIINPPYDVKMKEEDIEYFYKEIGDTLKSSFQGFDVWIFSANLKALKSIGLRTSKKIPLYNGALESRFNNYKIFKGSLKNKKTPKRDY
jgi:putative N6-adenine-specific DNA methylase